jgi:carnosine N-methyltransferase
MNLDTQEFKALSVVLHAHSNYSSWARKEIIEPKNLKYESLLDDEKLLLKWFPDYISQLQYSIDINAKYFNDVAVSMSLNWGAGDSKTWFHSSYLDSDKLRGVMAQYVREWSSEGVKEREISFGRIISASEKLFPNVLNRPDIKVLVPGAGLARLVVEFVKRGFQTQGNELSYHMLLNSNFLLNNTYCANNFVLSPFIHKSSNVAKRNYQCRHIYFPDFNPGDISLINIEYPTIPVQDLMSMVAGGFADLYGPPDLPKISELYTDDPTAVNFRNENKNKFNIVATCYFLDTATNIIDYLKTIKHCLNEDGYWINFGPLLWHFENDDSTFNEKVKNNYGDYENIRTPMKGLEISKDDLIQLIKDLGFEFIEHESDIESTYGGDSKSMGNWIYKCEYWICKKIRQGK